MPFDSGDYEANKEKKLAQDKAYREANKEKEAARKKAYREANKEKIAARKKAYYEANKEKMASKSRAYYYANIERERARNRAYKEANKEKLAAQNKVYYEANKERYKAYYEANAERYMYVGALKRAKKNNIPFNLTEDYLKSIYPSDMICPVLGFEMSVGLDENGSKETSPSLDRIIPEKGYVQGNVVVISMRANSIKEMQHQESFERLRIFTRKCLTI